MEFMEVKIGQVEGLSASGWEVYSSSGSYFKGISLNKKVHYIRALLANVMLLM